MLTITDKIKSRVFKSFNTIASQNDWALLEEDKNIVIEECKNQEHGDFATNIAMMHAKALRQSPQNIANKLIEELKKDSFFVKVEFANPGFINFTLSDKETALELENILQKRELYCQSDKYKGNKILVEFVSANPTGPLHIGHVRGAVVGDILASMFSKIGYDVSREYYINDAGMQIKTLANSLFIRYQELCGKEIEHPKDFYPGDYLIDIAKDLHKEHKESLLTLTSDDFAENYGEFVVDKIMDMIKKDLELIGVKHDSFVSEKRVVTKELYNKVDEILKRTGKSYYGMLEKPKSADEGEDYEPVELKLFKSTEFGDDTDRVLERSDGSLTYFGHDVVYHYNKYQRGFTKMVDILGADHAGYAKRVKASVAATSENNASLDVAFCGLVKLLKDGKPFKMSKRSGNFILLRDLAEEVDQDIIRTIMITRKNEVFLNLDVNALKEQNSSNPVFYIKYAFARVCSVKRNLESSLGLSFSKQELLESDKSLLTLDIEKRIMKNLFLFSNKIEQASLASDPNRFYNYVYNLASLLHNYWSIGKQDGSARVIQQDNIELTKARVALLEAFKTVFEVSLSVLGVNLLEEM